MVSPRFLDTVQTIPGNRQAAPSNPAFSISGGQRSGGFFSGGGAKNGDLIQHYTYWNYVAISRICDRVSTVFPNIGYKSASNARGAIGQGIGGEQGFRPGYLTQSQRQHLTRLYGGVLQSHQDLTPVLESHPLPALLQAVNPTDTWQMLVEDTFLFLQLTGEFYWWLVPSRLSMASGHKLPAEIWLIPTQFIQKWNYDREGKIVSYTMIPNGTAASRQDIPAEEILWYGSKNPFDRQRGHSKIQAAPYWTLNAEYIEESRGAGFRNGINPDLIIALEDDCKPNGADGESIVKTIKERLMQRASGFMKNREPVVIPPGVKSVTKWSNTPNEMDFSSSADQVRDQGLALHGVPKVIAGITTDVNRATVEGANVIFCENVLNPALSKFAGFLTEKLAVRYDPRIVIWYDDCTPRNAEQELNERKFAAQIGAWQPNEQRVAMGLAPINESAYNSGYIPSSVVPLSETVKEENMERALEIAGAREPAEDDETEDDDKGEKPGKKPPVDESGDDTDDEDEKKPVKKKKQAVAAGSSFPSLDLM